jgi:hypothetical protein
MGADAVETPFIPGHDFHWPGIFWVRKAIANYEENRELA